MKTKRNKYLIILFLLAAGTGLLLQSFRFNAPSIQLSENNGRWPSKRELRRNFWQMRKMLLVYGTGNHEFTADYQKLAEKMASKTDYVRLIVKPDSAVTNKELTGLPITLIGTAASNKVIGRIIDSLPIEFKDGTFRINDIFISVENDVVELRVYPNPLNRSLLMNIITGTDDVSILEHLINRTDRGFAAGDFVVHRDNKIALWGIFKQEADGPWQIDPIETRIYTNSDKLSAETEHYVFYYKGESLDQNTLQNLAERQEMRLKKFLGHFSRSGTFELPKIDFYLYETLEDKGLVTRNTDLSHYDLQNWEVHAVLNQQLDGNDFSSDAQLVVRKLLGTTKSPALMDGFGVYFSENWGRYGYEYWAKRIEESVNACSLRDLLDAKWYGKESYLFMRPLAGSFVAFLINTYGFEEFIDLYQRWPESGLPKSSLQGFNMRELQRGWLSHLSASEVKKPSSLSLMDENAHPVFQKGFCYAHEGYQIYNGYLSRKSAESLAKLKSLGTEWISITPFGYLRDRHKPDYFRYSFGAGAENDESVVTAFQEAKRLGMKVMLKPHVLMSGGDWGWPGEIEMKNAADWQKFFANYKSWIRHYALLAEMYQMDIFCIGVELLKTTRDHQSEWREIIQMVRQMYSGPLVYAANWGDEFEQITFWDELDYIGLNCYYPLSKKDKVTLEDLKAGAREFIPIIENIALKYNKPVILTEVGFCSRGNPWQRPHERARGSSPNFEDQALSYRAIFESFWGRPWFSGFYWWKWPTYLEYGGRNHSGFTPNGKLAEDVVAEWYSKSIDSPKTPLASPN